MTIPQGTPPKRSHDIRTNAHRSLPLQILTPGRPPPLLSENDHLVEHLTTSAFKTATRPPPFPRVFCGPGRWMIPLCYAISRCQRMDGSQQGVAERCGQSGADRVAGSSAAGMTSSWVRGFSNAKSEHDEDSDQVKFTCAICALSSNCRYGYVNISKRTQCYRYQEEVYYMLDPFRDRSKIDQRRLASKKSSSSGRAGGESKAASILDIFVIGALCTICGQPVCIDELCSVFYTKTFCTACVTRQKAHFPEEIVEQIETARKLREKREAGRRGIGTAI